VAPETEAGRCIHIDAFLEEENGARAHLQFAQEVTDPEKNSPIVIPCNEDDR
jgi:hypothetical protein